MLSRDESWLAREVADLAREIPGLRVTEYSQGEPTCEKSEETFSTSELTPSV